MSRHPLFLFPVLLGGLVFTALSAMADAPKIPGSGFPASRYETLWTKSPFAIITPDAADDSPDYTLVGGGFFEGVSYASMLEKQTNEHFLVSSEKPAKGLTLVSVARGNDSTMTATFKKDGQLMTLKSESPPVTAAPPMSMVPIMPNGIGHPVFRSGLVPPGSVPPTPFRRPTVIRIPAPGGQPAPTTPQSHV